MHARQLVELAAIVSAHGPVLIRGTKQLSVSSLEHYWSRSKCRLDRWNRSLKRFGQQVEGPGVAGVETRGTSVKLPELPPWGLAALDPSHPAQWPYVQGVLEEIITGEVLTRVWAAVLCAYDHHHGTEQAEPIARSVLIGHLEARHRVLTLLVRGPGVDAEAAVRLNHLRRRAERWTDLLVGYLTGAHDVGEFAVVPARARDFAEDLQYQCHLKGGRQAWPLVLASLRAAFRQGLCPTSPNADLNTQIASAILSCFQPELFDSTGLFRSLWMLRLSNATCDCQGMIEDLLALERSASGGRDTSASARLEDRLRRFGV